MIFKHAIKHNGVLYLAGEDVPIDAPSDDKVKTKDGSAQSIIDNKEPVIEPVKKRGRPKK